MARISFPRIFLSRCMVFLALPLALLLMAQCSSANLREDARFSYRNVYKDQYEKGKGGIIQLTLERGESYGGTITPDGKYLFFSSNRSGNFDIYLRAMDDVEIIPVTRSATNQKEPSISPDGKYLVYIDDELDPDGDIIMLRVRPEKMVKDAKKGKLPKENSGGWFSGKKNLTNSVKKRVRSRESNPVFSPDGEQIAFASDMTTPQGSPFGPGLGAIQNIWIMDPDKPEAARKVTEHGGVMPAFSPDGKKIVYVSYRNENSFGDIFETDLATGQTRQLTSGPDLDLNPSYTPDGRGIVLTRISQDNNGDGQVDRKDFGQIIRIDFPENDVFPRPAVTVSKTQPGKEENAESTETKAEKKPEIVQNVRTVPLTTNGVNVFDTKTSPFIGGSVIFALANGEDINIAFIPLTGEIPRQKDIETQYHYASQYRPQKNEGQVMMLSDALGRDIPILKPEAQKYSMALEKVEDFYGQDTLYPVYGPQKDEDLLQFFQKIGYPKTQEVSKVISEREKSGFVFGRILRELKSFDQQPSKTTKKNRKKRNRKKGKKGAALLVKAKDKVEYLQDILKNKKILSAYAPVDVKKRVAKFKRELLEKANEKKNLDGSEPEKATPKKLDEKSLSALKDYEAKLKKEFSRQEAIYKNLIATLQELLARELETAQKVPEALEVYRNILVSHPDFYHNPNILLKMGDLKADVSIPAEWLFILDSKKNPLFEQTKAKAEPSAKSGKKTARSKAQIESEQKAESILTKKIDPPLQSKARERVYDFLKKELEENRVQSVQQIQKSAIQRQQNDIIFLTHLALAKFFLDHAQPEKAEASLTQAKVPANTRWQFLGSVIRGGIQEYRRDSAAAFQTYYAAIAEYQPTFEVEGAEKLIQRTLDYFERDAEAAVARNDLGTAAQNYKVVTDLYLSLYAKGIMRDIIQKRFLDTCISLDQIALKSLGKNPQAVEDIKNFYSSRMDMGRRYLNNAFIFGRAYLYARMGIELHQRYEKEGISSSQKEEVLELFKIAEQDFKWSFFADPYFADSYVMLGWMYQFIDEKRETVIDAEDNVKDKDEFESLYAKYFPGYLFEENLKLYQKSIALFQDRIHPRILTSFHLNIANNYFLLSNYVKAEENYRFVYESFEKGDYRFESEMQEAQFLFHYGKSLYFKGDYEEAVKILEKTLAKYKKMAPIRGVANAAANQEKREIIRKYIAICSDYANKPDEAIASLQTVIREQEAVGRRHNRSVLNLEIARLFFEKKDYDSALNHVNIAEQEIIHEPKVEAPGFPVRVKWFFGISFSIWTMPADYVFVGQNLLAYDLPTMNRLEYLYSLRARIFKIKGLWPRALENLTALIQTAEKDKSKHGKETLIAAYMRLGELQYKLGQVDEARGSYEKTRELAQEGGDLVAARKAHKNILTIICRKIEDQMMTPDKKLKYIETSIRELEDFQKDYIEQSIEAARKKVKEKNEDLDLTPEEIALVRKQAISSLYRILLYKGILMTYQLEVELQRRNMLSPVDMNGWLTEADSLYKVASRALDIMSGNVAEESAAEKKEGEETEPVNYLNPSTDRKLILILNMNKARIFQFLNMLEKARLAYEQNLERAREYESLLVAVTANLRLSELNRSDSKKAEKYLLKARDILQENTWLLRKSVNLYQEVMRGLVRLYLEKNEVEKALVAEEMSRRVAAALIIGEEFQWPSHSNEPAIQESMKAFYEIEEDQVFLEEVQNRIESLRLHRGVTKNEEEARDELLSKLKKNYKVMFEATPELAATLFPHLDSGQVKLNRDHLYILKAMGGYKLISGKDGVFSKTVPEAAVQSFAQKLRSGQLTKAKLLSAPKEAEDTKEKKPNTNNLKDSSGNDEAKPWVLWLANQSPESVIVAGSFASVPWSTFYGKPVSQNHTMQEVSLFARNYAVTSERLVQIQGKSGLFGFFGGGAVKYDASKEFVTVKDITALEAQAGAAEVLDYEANLDETVSLKDTNEINLGSLFAVNISPSIGLLHIQTSKTVLAQSVDNYAAAANMIMALRGASMVYFSGKKRSEAKEASASFLRRDPSGPSLGSIAGNPGILQIWLKPKPVSKESESEKKVSNKKSDFDEYARKERKVYYAKALRLKKNKGYARALNYVNRALAAHRLTKEGEDTSLNLETLKNTLLFALGQVEPGKQHALAVLAAMEKEATGKETRKEKKKLRTFWLNYVTELYRANLSALAESEILEKKDKYSLTRQDWELLLSEYYLGQVRVVGIGALDSPPGSVFQKNLKKLKLAEARSERAYQLAAFNADPGNWADEMREQLEIDAAMVLYRKYFSKLDDSQKDSFLFMAGWAAPLLKDAESKDAYDSFKKLSDDKAAWLEHMRNPSFARLQKLGQAKLPVLWKDLAEYAYYVSVGNHEAASVSLERYFTEFQKTPSLDESAALLWSTFRLIEERTAVQKLTEQLLKKLNDYAEFTRKAKLAKNSQYSILLALMEKTESILKKPDNLGGIIADYAAAGISSLNQSLVNRMALLGAGYHPEQLTTFSYFQMDTFARDQKVLELLALIQKQAGRPEKLSLPKNQEEFSYLFTYFQNSGRSENAVRMFLEYDRSQKVTTFAMTPYRYVSLVETFPEKWYAWSIDSGKVQVTEIDSVSSSEWSKVASRAELYYLPLKNPVETRYGFQIPDHLAYSIRVLEKPDEGSEAPNMTYASRTKSGILPSILRIRFDNKVSENPVVALNEDISKVQGIYNLVQSTLKRQKINGIAPPANKHGWLILSTREKLDSVYYQSIRVFLTELKSTKNMVEMVKKTKDRLKQIFPDPADYNSVYYIQY